MTFVSKHNIYYSARQCAEHLCRNRDCVVREPILLFSFGEAYTYVLRSMAAGGKNQPELGLMAVDSHIDLMIAIAGICIGCL